MSRQQRYRTFRVAAAAAVATFVVGSFVWIVTADAEDSAKYATAAALLVAAVTLGFDIATFLRPERERSSIEELADELAATVEDQWLDEATARRLRDPHVLPLGWSLTDRNVGDSLESITGVRSGGRVTAARFDGRIADNFDKATRQLAESFDSLPNRRLVILGEPGAGKTVLALLLTLGLLRSRGRGAAVPVLLPASSWDPVTEPFDAWIARTLATSFYNGRTDVADRLLSRQLVLPIVDGLDEISENSRRVAIREINDSLHQGRAIVVTCRSVEYQDLVRDGAPRLRGAPVVEVAPLTGDDVVTYLKSVEWPRGVSWAEVYGRIQGRSDTPLRAAMSTPLMVSMARMVFERLGGDPGELADERRFDSRHTIEDHITGLVVDAAYAPGTTHTERGPWDSVKARRWLAFLAQYLHQHRERDLAWWLMSQRLLGAWVGPAIGVISGTTLMTVASAWLVIAQGGRPIDFYHVVTIGVIGGAIAVLSTVVWYASTGRRPGRLSFGSAGSFARLRSGFRTGLLVTAIPAVPVLIAIGVSITILDIWTMANIHRYFEIVGQVLAGTVVVGAALAVHDWLDTPPERAESTSPEALLRQDRQSSINAAATAGVVFGAVAYPALIVAATVASVVSGALMDWPGWPGEQEIGSIAAARRADATSDRFDTPWLLAGLAFVLPGLVFAMLVFLTRAWPRFTITCIVLAARGRLPLRLPAFLEDARQRQLLRQVGGSYQFRHARLQEHLVNRPLPDHSEPSSRSLAGIRVTRRRVAVAAAVLLAVSTIPLQRLPDDTSTLTLHGTYDDYTRFELSPDNSTIATFDDARFGGDHRIVLWDFNTGKRLRELTGLRGSVDSVQFAAEGRTLVGHSGRYTEYDTSDDALMLWDANTGRVLRSLDNAAGYSLLGGGQVVIATSNVNTPDSPDYITRLWSAADGQELQTLSGQDGHVDIEYSPQGTLLFQLLTDDRQELWTVSPPRKTVTTIGAYDHMFSNTESHLLTVHAPATVRLWNAQTGQEVMSQTDIDIDIEIDTLSETEGFVDVTFDRHDSRLAIAAGRQTSRIDDDAVWLWNTENGKRLLRLTDMTGGIDDVSFSDNGAILAVRTGGRSAAPEDDIRRLWDARTGQPLASIPAHTGDIYTVAISPNGATLLVSSDNQTPNPDDDSVQLLSVDGSLIKTLPGVSPKNAGKAKYSPDGSILVTGPGVRFWRSVNAERLSVDDAAVEASGVIFIDDGETAVIGYDGWFEVRKIAANRTLGQFAFSGWDEDGLTNDPRFGKVDSIFQFLMLSADGRFLAAPGDGHIVTLWDLRAGRQLHNLTGHTAYINQAEFTKDNCRLVTSSDDRTVRVWSLPCS